MDTLYEALQSIKIKNTEVLYEDELQAKIEAAYEGYKIILFDMDDYSASELAGTVASEIASYADEGYAVECLQTESWCTEDEDAEFFVLAIPDKQEDED